MLNQTYINAFFGEKTTYVPIFDGIDRIYFLQIILKR